VELKGVKGTPTNVDGLFDEGALVNSICNQKFPSLQRTLGVLTPSSKILRMADGRRVFSDGRWCGNVTLGGRTVKSCFEVFPSGGGWSLLFGKPLLKQFEAIHDYGNDTLKIPSNGTWTTLLNECEEIPTTRNVEDGDIDMHPSENPANTVSEVPAKLTNKGKCGRGRRNRRNRQKLGENVTQPSKLEQERNTVWTVLDADNNPIEPLGDLQPEIEINNDHSLFTRMSDPHNQKRVEEILRQVSIGTDLSSGQRDEVRNLIAEFADCFALSVREVILIPGAEHHIHVPPDAVFPKKIPHQ